MVILATMSSKGQIVIPAPLRRQAELAPGDGVVIDFDERTQELRLRKADALAAQIDAATTEFNSWINPGTPPLPDASALYETREPRL
jgi:AbrB family looped-hinge helix DNA binding protein